ncbi:MAG: hypothetical protein ACTS5A_02885 [Candidatus Hodgkinia cicadicola]
MGLNLFHNSFTKRGSFNINENIPLPSKWYKQFNLGILFNKRRNYNKTHLTTENLNKTP